MVQFEKPTYKITDYIESNFYGKFELEPLERGFGTTLGNALRRVMLSSLPGSAISSVKIDGVSQEFQTIDGVIEDVALIILNLKDVVIKNHTNENRTLRLNAKKEGPVTAGDIEHDADIEILNPDKPVILDFWAAWCGPCRMASPIVDMIAGENPDIKVGKVNVDEEQELAAAFGVMSIPTFVAINGGKEINRTVGAVPKETILKMLGR